ncbi:SAM-dependent methyltransferase [Mycolicibacterium austroafricanum]|uniref:SAM-dependent methyltransferase n=1 Tax=Mycolicibacterium austroafricanum TaxID=39687 RepID=A0ABT8HQ16_MYCAO|nr:SAM-dependent methyltransferase [Mycolicibacterium austroafricanum]MDN4522605.1 SAM-dependent methyltransferase [Mycolicibacterium austroafricanum]QRZ07033.1 SAM-dependent methyltransferase [Mycolicibacterium austroafricanum]QZT68519.1 SAM-dependent methyltransferase [Mycolicibacterium austroafricanum]
MREDAYSDLHWYQWHSRYDDLESDDTDRLEVVQEVLASVLDTAPSGALAAVSVCAGQARDLLPVLIHHPRGHDVSARLVELDPLNASFLHGAIGSTGLTGIDLVVGDGGEINSYHGALPADLVLLAGVFAHIDMLDVHRTIASLPAFCRPGGVVVWSSYGPGMINADAVLAQFESGAFQRHRVIHGTRADFLVAAHRYTGPRGEFPSGQRLFSFK